MRDETVIAIQKEIGRLLENVQVQDMGIQRARDKFVRYPGDPVDEELAIQWLLEKKNKWQTAVNRRVLQLAGLDSGVGIDTTWEGRMDLDLPSAW